MPINENEDKNSEIKIENRSYISISGVEDVISFDENSVLLKTTLGIMLIEGDELKIQRIDTDRQTGDIKGYIKALSYSDINIKKKGSGYKDKR